MLGVNVLNSLINCLVPLAFIIFYAILEKYTPYKKLNAWIRSIIIGLCGGALIILNLCYGFSVILRDDTFFNIGLCSLVILSIGIIIDYKSAIIAAFIGIIFRSAYHFPNESIIGLGPTILTLFVSCIVVVLIEFVTKKENKVSWLFAFLIGIFVESCNFLFVYLFTLKSVPQFHAKGLAALDIFAIIMTGVLLALSIFVVNRIRGKANHIRLFKNKKLISKIRVRMAVLGITFFAASFTVTYLVSSQAAMNDCYNNMYSAVETMKISTENIKLYSPETIKEEVSNLALRSSIMDKGVFAIVNREDNTIWSTYEKFVDRLGKVFTIDGHQGSFPYDYKENTLYKCSLIGMESYIFYMNADGPAGSFYIIGIVPSYIINYYVGSLVRMALYQIVILFTIIFTATTYTAKRLIVRNIYRVNDSLRKITAGDLYEVVNVRDTEEFVKLSNDINATVTALKNYAKKAQERLEVDNQLAKDIQKNSMINVFPVEHGFDVYGYMQTANEAGGTFYDYIKLNKDQVAFIIADVVGKGISSVMYMIQAKAAIRYTCALAGEGNKTVDLKTLINRINKDCVKNAPVKTGLAFWIGILNTTTGDFDFVNCNGVKPLIKLGNEYKVLEARDNIYLGVDDTYEFKPNRIKLVPGNELLLLTDGVIVNANKEGATYGVDGVLNRLSKIQYFTARQIVEQVSDDIAHFIDNAPLKEDITMLSFRYTGINNKRPEHEITLKAIPNNTPIATKFVESIMQQYSCSPASQAVMLIAVDELFSNIAYYAYKGKPEGGNGTIRIEIKDKEFRLILIDNGVPFNPLSHLDPNYITASAEERTNKGGLGIFMVRNSVDDMQYKYEDGQNILTIIKNIPEMHEEEFKDSYSTTRD